MNNLTNTKGQPLTFGLRGKTGIGNTIEIEYMNGLKIESNFDFNTTLENVKKDLKIAFTISNEPFKCWILKNGKRQYVVSVNKLGELSYGMVKG